jgi:hypothetical protein
MNVLQLRNTTPFRRQIRVVCQGRQNISLSQGQENLGVLLRVRHYEVLNLVAPEHSISLLDLGFVPYLKQLFDAPGSDKMCLFFGLWPIEGRPEGSSTGYQHGLQRT